jgi:integral membrane protein
MRTLRFLAVGEGISWILLILTMMLKYGWGIKEPNYVVGMAHGVLFIGFCMSVVYNHVNLKWDQKKTGILLLASLVPFMTFWAEKRYLRN